MSRLKPDTLLGRGSPRSLAKKNEEKCECRDWPGALWHFQICRTVLLPTNICIGFVCTFICNHWSFICMNDITLPLDTLLQEKKKCTHMFMTNFLNSSSVPNVLEIKSQWKKKKKKKYDVCLLTITGLV